MHPDVIKVAMAKFDAQHYLDEKPLKEHEDPYKRNKFNQKASDAARWDRNIPDVRDHRLV